MQFTDITISPNNITQHCVEVHAVISHYIIECMESDETINLSPIGENLNTARTVEEKLVQQLHGVHDPSSLTVVDYLKFKLSEIENNLLPFFLKTINIYTITEPHIVLLLLQQMKDVLMRSPSLCTLILNSRGQ